MVVISLNTLAKSRGLTCVSVPVCVLIAHHLFFISFFSFIIFSGLGLLWLPSCILKEPGPQVETLPTGVAFAPTPGFSARCAQIPVKIDLEAEDSAGNLRDKAFIVYILVDTNNKQINNKQTT